jgi:Arc/MetJ-type ribon-helix-helix transcriptional regulator
MGREKGTSGTRETATFSISLPEEMLDEIDRVRKEQKCTRSEFVREALRQHIENHHTRQVRLRNGYREAIQRRAYELYEMRGRADGHNEEDWQHAEREINRRQGGDRRKIVTGPWPGTEHRRGVERRTVVQL